MTKGNPAFKDGKLANSGRQKGTKNKRTQEALKRVEWVLEILEKDLEADIKKLSSNERVKLWDSLQEYVRPKLQRTELVGDEDKPIKLLRFEVYTEDTSGVKPSIQKNS